MPHPFTPAAILAATLAIGAALPAKALPKA